jgi:hypothetical protein
MRRRHVYHHRHRQIPVNLFDAILATGAVMLVSYIAAVALLEGWI